MQSVLLVLFVCSVALALIAVTMLAISRKKGSKKVKKKDRADTVNSKLLVQSARLDREGALREIVRLRDSGKLDESLIENLSSEERALFEIALIDALTEWPRDDQHKLRSALIKHGYDDQCARRLMKDSISSSVRASTLLNLLRPQSRTNPPKTCRYRSSSARS